MRAFTLCALTEGSTWYCRPSDVASARTTVPSSCPFTSRFWIRGSWPPSEIVPADVGNAGSGVGATLGAPAAEAEDAAGTSRRTDVVGGAAAGALAHAV